MTQEELMAFRMLPEEERLKIMADKRNRVMDMRDKGKSFAEIGKVLNIHGERARQIMAKELRRRAHPHPEWD